jgi:hypothetical protein
LNQVSAMGFASGSIEMSVTSREHGKMTWLGVVRHLIR